MIGVTGVRNGWGTCRHFCHGLLALLPACGRGPSGPNVILISLDTLRADHLGLYGYPLDTSPNLEPLAARGTVFDNAYSQAPNTASSTPRC